MTPNAVMPASSRTAAPTSSARECAGGGRPRAVAGSGWAAVGGSSAGSCARIPLVQALQLGARLDPDLVHERGARRPVRGERVGLAAGAIEREHVLRAEVLAQRLRRDQRLELADHLGMAPRLEIGVDRHLART